MNRRIWISKFGLVASISVALLASLLITFAIMPTKVASATSGQSDWQSNLSDDTPVSHLSIPGTHNSTAFNIYQVSFIKDRAECQSENIESQLASGIRAFDLRYKYEYNKFYLYHGSYACNDSDNGQFTLNKVFDKLATYLKAHPNEFVIVNLQKESGNYNSTALTQLKNEYGIYTNFSHNTKVKDIRGKIVDASGYMQSASGIYNTWNTTVNGKVSDLKNVFSAAPSVSKNYVGLIDQKVTYTNIAFQTSALFTTPKNYASEVQKYFLNSDPFKSYGQKAYGIVMYDYPTQSIIDYTVTANDWAKDTRPRVTVTFTNGGSNYGDIDEAALRAQFGSENVVKEIYKQKVLELGKSGLVEVERTRYKVSVVQGEKISMPKTTSAEGKTLRGFIDYSVFRVWNFDTTAVTQDVTLQGIWS